MSGMAASGVLRSGGASLVGSPFVAVKNTSASPQTATVSCFTESDSASQQVQLAAEGWALLRVCAGSSSNPAGIFGDALVPATQEAANRGAFGLSVTGSGKAGTLSVFGLAWRGALTGAILSSQNFADVGTLRSGNTVFTGVPVGVANYLPGATFTPQLAMTNFGTKPVNASVLFARTTDSGPEIHQRGYRQCARDEFQDDYASSLDRRSGTTQFLYLDIQRSARGSFRESGRGWRSGIYTGGPDREGSGYKLQRRRPPPGTSPPGPRLKGRKIV